jgi:NADH-ubiquinone oxidoreductase chain 4
VSGSMILAGVLLKLGGYGLCRVLEKFPAILIKASGGIMGLGLLGIVYVGLICCRLNDIRALVAYRSVAHIGIVAIGLFIGSEWGFNGALIIILGHGLASSGLFCALNIYYERTGRRRFYLNKGLILILPGFCLIFFILCGANIAAPPTINLLAEIYLMARIFSYDKLILLVFPLGSFLGAVFRIFLFSFSQHGKRLNSLGSYCEGRVVEYLSFVLHIIPLNILVFKYEFFML